MTEYEIKQLRLQRIATIAALIGAVFAGVSAIPVILAIVGI